MAKRLGRPDNLNDAVEAMGYNIGQTPHEFLGADGDKSFTYKNLVMHGGLNKPTEQELLDKLTEIQAEWDVANAPYILNRGRAYPPVSDQLDMMYHDQKDGTTVWLDTIEAVKTKYPKPSN
ncbi:hypothetical protein LCGC14_1662040 [marine sediment metagenome]|uniref:Uncharacterized protein n=1 Tax=marine sediment metagenome TaxID=412755 RepID=A0A0F9HTT3_9ZZZZ